MTFQIFSKVKIDDSILLDRLIRILQTEFRFRVGQKIRGKRGCYKDYDIIFLIFFFIEKTSETGDKVVCLDDDLMFNLLTI